MPGRPGFFLPVRILSRVFRGKFLHHLRRAFDEGRLALHGRLSTLEAKVPFRSFLSPLYSRKWVVYAKRPFNGPQPVLKYLARYTHRVAIANSRLGRLEGGTVSFSWKDYAHGGKQRIMKLRATEFLRRFLLHILPKGFVRIRHYGFLSNRCRVKSITLIQGLLGGSPSEPCTDDNGDRDARAEACPVCERGRMVTIDRIAAGQPFPLPCPIAIDSS